MQAEKTRDTPAKIRDTAPRPQTRTSAQRHGDTGDKQRHRQAQGACLQTPKPPQDKKMTHLAHKADERGVLGLVARVLVGLDGRHVFGPGRVVEHHLGAKEEARTRVKKRKNNMKNTHPADTLVYSLYFFPREAATTLDSQLAFLHNLAESKGGRYAGE